MKERFSRLYTTEGENISGIPHDEYPRPQMRRTGAGSGYHILNGKWTFKSRENDCEILVPFCPESLLSQVKGKVRYGETLYYSRELDIDPIPSGYRIILHFGAVSGRTRVYVNDRPVCSSDNSYLPFSADITSAAVSGTNSLRVEVVNDLDPVYPHGKQRKKRGGMWYTPVSGIWQTVWFETAPEEHIVSLDIEADDEAAEIRAHFAGEKGKEETGDCEKADDAAREFVALCEGKEYHSTGGKVRIAPEERKLWSPDNPCLYKVLIKTDEDEVETYFALRKLDIRTVNGKKRLCLNGDPLFFNAVLDQGYFSDGLYTPASLSLYAEDILKMKELGFNTLRKHIKIEPERFYYECDRLGMVVFQDMVNNGKYSFLRDTAMPTVGIGKIPGGYNFRPAVREKFLNSMEATVLALRNHPSICYWTIFNEGWGQADADGAYERLKALDTTRFIDSTSGWFKEKESDVESLHIYFKPAFLGKDRTRPQVLSEFGGFVYKCPENSFNLRKTCGYGISKTREEYAKTVRKKYEDEIIPLAGQGLCAAVYTQVSDVEDETNGILTFDRKVCKLLPEEMAGIAESLQNAVRL